MTTYGLGGIGTRGLALVGLLAVSFSWGLLLAAADWLDGLGLWPALAVLALPPAMPVTVFVASLLRDASRGAAVTTGAVLGALLGAAEYMGLILLHILGVGGRDFSGELSWSVSLIAGVALAAMWAVFGALVGGISGVVGWEVAGWLSTAGGRTRTVRLGLFAIGAGLLVTGVVAGLILFEDEGAAGGWSIDDARAFDEFSLYWVGEEYDDLRLTEVIRAKYENSVAFIYGSCTPSGEGGCAPPLQIVVRPCTLEPREPVGAGDPFDVRGAMARNVGGFGDHLRIRTRDVVVTIFSRPGTPIEVAQHLRLVGEGPEGAEKPLGPPNVSC